MTAAAPGARLPERPPICAPAELAIEGQPRLGLAGLVLVVPIAAALAFAAGGAEGTVLVLGPLVTFSLPLVAMVAFWWEDRPGTTLRPAWSGWADTVLIAAGAVVLTGLGQGGRPPGSARHLRPVPRRRARAHLPGDDAARRRGWPFSLIATRRRRLACAHVVVIAAGLLTLLVVHDILGVGTEPLAAYAASFVAAALLLSMQLEGWLDRSVTLIAAVALTAVLAPALYAVADGLRFTRASEDAWVTHVALNALGASVLLHVAVGRRWPFDAG